MPFQSSKSSHNLNRLINKILIEPCRWHIYILFDLIFIALAFRIWLLSAPKKVLIANGYYSDICVKINYKLHPKVVSSDLYLPQPFLDCSIRCPYLVTTECYCLHLLNRSCN